MEFSSFLLVLHLTYSSNITLTSLTCFWLDCKMPMKQQWKWVIKYPDRLPEHSDWIDRKKNVISEFTEFMQTGHLLRQSPLYSTTIERFLVVLEF